MIYLYCDNIDMALTRAVELGGAVHGPKTPLPMDGMGWIASIRDLDGNAVGLHQMP